MPTGISCTSPRIKEIAKFWRWFSIILVFGIFTGALVCQQLPNDVPAPALGTIAFVDVNLVPMDVNVVIAHQTVIVRGCLVARIGSAASIPIPSGALRIEGHGKNPNKSDSRRHERQDDAYFRPNLSANEGWEAYNRGRPKTILNPVSKPTYSLLQGAYHFQQACAGGFRSVQNGCERVG